jgi:hypothetical protein
MCVIKKKLHLLQNKKIITVSTQHGNAAKNAYLPTDGNI